MFLHLLSNDNKEEFIKIARLISICDNELKWNGKTLNDAITNEDLEHPEFNVIPAEEEVLRSCFREIGMDESEIKVKLIIKGGEHDDFDSKTEYFGGKKIFSITRSSAANTASASGVTQAFSAKLATCGLLSRNDSVTRANVALELLRSWVSINESENPSIGKIMLFELISLCLADGQISNIEMQLLKEFCTLRKIDEWIFDDLLERAKITNAATLKTIAIIFE